MVVKRKSGQSLIEVTIALSIMSACLTIVTTLMVHTLGFSNDSMTRITAIGYAQEQMEETIYKLKNTCIINQINTSTQEDGFLITTAVEPVTAAGPSELIGMKKVLITVSWDGRGNKSASSISVVTYLWQEI